MEVSIFIAKLIGLIYLVIGLGLIFNPKYYHKMFNDLLNDAPLTYISGMLALVIGLLFVIFHNIWLGSWVVVITVFGWLALVKGVLLLVFPKAMKKFSKGLFKTSNVLMLDGFIGLIFGLVFVYFGFFA
jgi:uncharacterized protein YjeT (DUF2065 family)